MANSIEGRVPFLDHRIVELCFQIPDEIRFVNKQLKGLLKHTMRGILPEEILHLPKAGFTGPTKHWINTSLKESIYRNIVEDTIPFFKEYLDINTIKSVINNNERNGRYSETLFLLYIFSLWYKRHLEGREIAA
jgi:asparagine synthase (glutamine-hydrolysing)